MSKTIKVTVKTFGPWRVTDERYKELREKLKDRKRFRVWDLDGTGNGVVSGEYHIQTNHLFNNQSTTAEGFRIFDFADYSRHPDVRDMRYGHYIEDISELEEARAVRAKCGYCGHSEDHAAGQWCPKCRGSEYLKPEDYRLLQMLPVSSDEKRDEEPPADVIASIDQEQRKASAARAEKAIANKIASLEQDQLNAQHEIDFIRACVAAGILSHELNNMIYYSHKNRFNFGWREPISTDQAESIEKRLKDADQWHMFDVDFKTA